MASSPEPLKMPIPRFSHLPLKYYSKIALKMGNTLIVNWANFPLESTKVHQNTQSWPEEEISCRAPLPKGSLFFGFSEGVTPSLRKAWNFEYENITSFVFFFKLGSIQSTHTHTLNTNLLLCYQSKCEGKRVRRDSFRSTSRTLTNFLVWMLGFLRLSADEHHFHNGFLAGKTDAMLN